MAHKGCGPYCCLVMLMSVVCAAGKVYVGPLLLLGAMLMFMVHAAIEAMLGLVLMLVASNTTEGQVNVHDLCCHPGP